ncbi:DUF6020 family protein [Microbacterium indicum]|uniref:DUF6020 family protein n=1 Tax=Microbacterium indicum TaxID=358100 RepID=UPI00041B9D39|nr:DUF6020 family protein [Microbacterium indicum]
MPRGISWAAASIGALAAALAFAAGGSPETLRTAFDDAGGAGLLLFVAALASGRWVLARASAGTWAWAAPLGGAFALAETAGISLAQPGAGFAPIATAGSGTLAWWALHLVGVGWAASCAVAALLIARDRARARDTAGRSADRSRLGRAVGAVASGRPAALAILAGVIAASRVPVYLLWFPGIVPFDTFRSFASVRTGEWELYEPLGHSILVAGMDFLGTTLGWGDTAAVAIGAALQILTSSLACAFMLWRVAAWGVRPGIWAGASAWVALSPVLALFSVTIIKDSPFASVLVVFLTCVGDLTIARGASARRRRVMWILLGASGALVVMARNNGVYVVVLGLVILTALAWRRRPARPIAVLAGVLVVFALYSGPLAHALGARPGPAAEAWSLPVQQLARIAADDQDRLTPDERGFLDRIFPANGADGIGARYDPSISDSVKADAHHGWAHVGTGPALAGWLRLAAAHPVPAIEATLAGTVGYWAPSAPSYDGIPLLSSNDVRDVHLDIPSGLPDAGAVRAVYESGMLGDGLRRIPVLGLLVSPGFVTWAWIVCAAMVLRERRWRAAALFVPAGVLLLTLVAGPVSGGMRYSLALFAALPLAAGAACAAVPGAADDPAPGERSEALRLAA